MTTWGEIRKAAEAAGFYRGWMDAETNAHTTIYEEKACGPEEFDRLALSSLQDALCSGNLDAEEHQFFVDLGVEY